MAGRLEKLRPIVPAVRLLGTVALILVSGCFNPNPAAVPSGSADTGGLSHTVQPGETIYHIARAYGVSPESLMAVNGLSDPRRLWPGQILVVPTNQTTTGLLSPSPMIRADRQFAWPVQAGLVSSPFGMRNGVMHDGIDISAAAGTAVRAADDGIVIFVGRLHGYGNAVILRHSGGYVTIYGHNRCNLVRYGAEVVRGQVIAELGSTGRATGPNLHFEVRFHGQPQNPLAYLPQPPPSSRISFARRGGS